MEKSQVPPKENYWCAFARSKDALINLRRQKMSPLEVVRIGQQIVSIRISRVEGDRSREIALRLRPIVATSIDVAVENKKRRAVRQTRTRDGEFGHCAVVISMTTKKKIGFCKMGFRGIRSKSQCSLDCCLGEKNPVPCWIEIEKIEQIVCPRRITIRGQKVLVAFDGFLQQLQCFQQRGSHVLGDEIAIDDLFRLKIKLKGDQILSWAFFDLGFLLGRKFCLELRDN